MGQERTSKRKEQKDKEHEKMVAELDTSYETLCFGAYAGNGGNSEALAAAALEGDLSSVKKLIAEGFDLESHDGTGLTMLSEAACTGNDELVKLLLDLGADPNTC